MFEGYAEYYEQDARLTILKALHAESDGRLNEVLITKNLDAFGYRRSRNWVRTQLRALEEVGVIKIAEAGTVMLATLLQSGVDHVERRTIVEGIARPSAGN